MSDGEGPARFRLRWYEEVGSTNDIARAAAEAGEPEVRPEENPKPEPSEQEPAEGSPETTEES